MRPLDDQTILITGSTDGHGRRVAEELVARGAAVLVHGRDPDKVARVTEEIGAARGLVADLARLDDVRRLADEVDQLDTLVNNAGIVIPERQESADGYELTFAVNYLSHFLLTALLLPKLREPARIVNVSSIGQYPLDFDDLQYEHDFNGYYAYAKSKLAQILFTRELAERLGDRDVTVNALHPATLMDTNMVLGPGGTPHELGRGGGGGDSPPDRRPLARRRDRRLLQRQARLAARRAGRRPRGAPAAVGGERAPDRLVVTRWIVDGMNVIGSRPTGWWHDRPGAMRAPGLPARQAGRARDRDLRRPAVRDRRTGRRRRSFRQPGRSQCRRRRHRGARRRTPPIRRASAWSPRIAELARRVRERGAEVVGAGEFRARH